MQKLKYNLPYGVAPTRRVEIGDLMLLETQFSVSMTLFNRHYLIEVALDGFIRMFIGIRLPYRGIPFNLS